VGGASAFAAIILGIEQKDSDMAKEEADKRVSDYLEAMKKERGYLPASLAYAATKDLDFVLAYDKLYSASLSDGKAFPAKYKELVAAGILAYKGFDPAVYEHLKRALKLGATKLEVLEAMEATIVPGGWPAFGAGLRALMKIEEDEKKEK
jgi:alkylhydroperoxidase/carboxymuconolactone decarboxylase family protein YurZ